METVKTDLGGIRWRMQGLDLGDVKSKEIPSVSVKNEALRTTFLNKGKGSRAKSAYASERIDVLKY